MKKTFPVPIKRIYLPVLVVMFVSNNYIEIYFHLSYNKELNANIVVRSGCYDSLAQENHKMLICAIIVSLIRLLMGIIHKHIKHILARHGSNQYIIKMKIAPERYHLSLDNRMLGN